MTRAATTLNTSLVTADCKHSKKGKESNTNTDPLCCPRDNIIGKILKQTKTVRSIDVANRILVIKANTSETLCHAACRYFI